MGVFGIVGITATANVSPNILTASTCNCIPSALVRLQELSVILLAFAAILAPIGLTRRTAGGGSRGLARVQSATTLRANPTQAFR